YYPNLQVTLGGKTIGRAPKGLTPASTEEDVDAYLNNRESYPVGTFDDTSDGNGNPVKNMPLFRTDLAAPWATAGEHRRLDDISNASYTMNLDQTTLVTPEGKQFMAKIGGAAGAQLTKDYETILKETGVTAYPFVKATKTGQVGKPESLVGLRVDNKKLLDMNAYLDSVPAPRGAKVNADVAARGQELFRANCTTCHNVDQNKRVPPSLVDLKTLWPGYNPTVLADRAEPLSPIQNSPGTFDDKMIVIDASHYGSKRGNALPLLLDLDRTTLFLHDASVHSLDDLLDPKRGATAPHPFYFRKVSDREDMVVFLRGLETKNERK
ncbi:MAG: c-type cytochrome, partial [Nitrospirales bacterium]|nr:c-type cytochrome [Nitrospirales bacterium]